jgi:glutaredoxin-like protein NrdH
VSNRITTIWTNPVCQPCRITKKALDDRGVPYVVKPLTEHPDGVESLKARGLATAPIVEPFCGTAWAGLNLERINDLEARYKRATEAAAAAAA